MKDLEYLVIAIGVFLIGIALFFIGLGMGEGRIQKQAIAHGAAQYNPTNATFEWKTLK